MFQDVLRIAIRAQQLVVFAALIVSLFALSVVPVENLYARARTQIDTAISIDWSKYDGWVEDRLKTVKKTRELALQQFEARQTFGSNKNDEPIAAALNLIESNRRASKAGEMANRELLTRLELDMGIATTLFHGWNETPNHFRTAITTPLDIIRYVSSAHANKEAAVFSVNIKEIDQIIWQNIADTVVFGDRYTAPVLLASEVGYQTRAYLAPPNGKIDLSEDFGIPTGVLTIDINGSWFAPENSLLIEDRMAGNNRSLSLNYEPDRLDVPNTSIAVWLSEQYPELGQMDETDKFIPFSGLEYVWREIADRPLSDSDLYLSALLAEEKRRNQDSVSMFGLNIPAPLVPIVGPLAIIFLLINLSRLVSHIRQRANEHRAEIYECAWLVLHSKRGWWADPLVSYILLPLMMQFCIALKLRGAEPFWVNAGWLMMVLVTFLGARVWEQLAKFRYEISTWEQTPGAII